MVVALTDSTIADPLPFSHSRCVTDWWWTTNRRHIAPRLDL